MNCDPKSCSPESADSTGNRRSPDQAPQPIVQLTQRHREFAEALGRILADLWIEEHRQGSRAQPTSGDHAPSLPEDSAV